MFTWHLASIYLKGRFSFVYPARMNALDRKWAQLLQKRPPPSQLSVKRAAARPMVGFGGTNPQNLLWLTLFSKVFMSVFVAFWGILGTLVGGGGAMSSMAISFLDTLVMR